MSFYPKLPNELKRKIWESAIEDRAIHHFKLQLPNPDGDVQEMSIEPITGADSSKASAQTDPSPWRDFWNLSAVNHLSRLVVGPIENRLTVWATDKERLAQLERKPQRGGASEAAPLHYGERATINAARDLVRFKLVGEDLDTGLLENYYNHHLLRGIRHVAFDWKIDGGHGKSDWLIRPFDCVGDGHGHDGVVHCHHILCDFLALFENLETFYFIIKVTKGEINMRWLTQLENKMRRQGNAGAIDLSTRTRQKKAPQLIRETMMFFREAAKANGLEVFHDRKRTYYEVRVQDTRRLITHRHLWKLLRRLEDRWNARLVVRTRQSADGLTAERVPEPKFKALVYAA
ncbi:hypothetical protein DL765_007136 [Monosporascus sp. GIB2]|nr:hypothetical protein DL765_007136 [Monosporascus sp. GIB2]